MTISQTLAGFLKDMKVKEFNCHPKISAIVIPACMIPQYKVLCVDLFWSHNTGAEPGGPGVWAPLLLSQDVGFL